MKQDGNPMHPAQRLLLAPRCTARAKRTGSTCKAPAVRGWSVCRMHGAHGGAPSGPGNGYVAAWRAQCGDSLFAGPWHGAIAHGPKML